MDQTRYNDLVERLEGLHERNCGADLDAVLENLTADNGAALTSFGS